ncbi:heme-dependent oxidative N-demethylase family protein [Acidisphaera rubrifaciens]|uniref:DUF3445 domain-containing protein n=1 Tax=Acidisphaera rubrifaciens HS-AP3 TaxID=1231350 RepID=A0A0D6P5B1_9PROT|nr:DUF3445 domain-containing protein [Acidisphaera rubrifaciens]GAN76074.1 hypothetical protein Asru_0047_12 [Acidisphaera rubrifaciens HS-AP3]
MTIAGGADDTFRGKFSFRNSDAAIIRFPFPFHEDRYMYAVNLEPHTHAGPTDAFVRDFDVDEHYVAECRERALVLEQDPSRCRVLAHMMDAEWDTLELLMESLARDYPALFALDKDGARWRWRNRPLGIDATFTFGDPSTLPQPPFEYITRQVQGDFTLQDQRDDNIYIDGGMVTTQADWSLDFDLGMAFHEWHGPVPVAHDLGVFDRALKYLLRLQYGRPVRRLNWTMTVNPRLDTSPENYPIWGPDRATVTAGNVGERLHLRVELQTLFRLPRSNGILFGIRCYLISLNEILRVPKWRRRLHRVLRDLHPELVTYKGLSRYLPTAVAFLAAHDDGALTGPGIQPDQAAPDPL